MTNEPKGDATVTYEDPHAALAAVEWFNNKDFHGATIGVLMAESKNKDDMVNHVVEQAPLITDDVNDLEEGPRDADGAAGRGRGRGDAAGKPWQQDGDWLCTNTRSVMRLLVSCSFLLFYYFFFCLNQTLVVQTISYTCCGNSCGNVNFAFRGVCNRCGTARPAGASGGGAAGGGRGRGRGNNDSGGPARAAAGAAGGGLFGPNDWPCPM